MTDIVLNHPSVEALRCGTLAQAVQEVAASAGKLVLITIRLQCPPNYSQVDPYSSYSYYDEDPDTRPPYEAGGVTLPFEAEGVCLEKQRWLNKVTIQVTDARILSELTVLLNERLGNGCGSSSTSACTSDWQQTYHSEKCDRLTVSGESWSIAGDLGSSRPTPGKRFDLNGNR